MQLWAVLFINNY